MTASERVSLAQARRIALAAQGLAKPRPVTAPGLRQATAVLQRLGVVQVDAVSVLARAHLMPFYSRLGPYDVALLDRMTAQPPRRIIEAWAHEASYIPVDLWPLLAWRRAAGRANPWHLMRETLEQHPGIVEHVLELLAERGPLTAKEAHEALVAAERTSVARRDTGWGSWSAAKAVLEYLFRTGDVLPAGRTAQFERRFDLTERVLPTDVLQAPVPDEPTAIRALIERAARAHGIATVRDLADYYRLGIPQRPAVASAINDLVADGILVPVAVVEHGEPLAAAWYLHRDARVPRRAEATALLSPFDPLTFERTRLQTLFGVDYRLEIYTPAHKRTHGYYVLPFLVGDRIAARVDLKADRATDALVVKAAHREPDHFAGSGRRRATSVARATDVRDDVVLLSDELRLMADWLDLDRIVVGPTGDLATALDEALNLRGR